MKARQQADGSETVTASFTGDDLEALLRQREADGYRCTGAVVRANHYVLSFTRASESDRRTLNDQPC